MQPFKDDDDIDLFISPGRFSGRTPSAASTRGRIFGEMLNEAKNTGGGKGPGIKGSVSAHGVRKNTHFRDEWGKAAPPLPKGIVEQARVRGIISTANLLAACVGLIVIGASAWIARKQRNPGLFALFQVDVQLLLSPLYFGIVLFASGLAMVLFGAAIGAGPLAEGLASGYILQDQRKLFISYQILLFLSLIGLCLTTVASMTPLMNFKGLDSIDPGVWNRMSTSLLCKYEQANDCGGLNMGSCSLKAPLTVAQTQTCPGLFCSKFCAKNNSSTTLDCSRCKQLRKADVCRAHELNANRQTGCGGLLLNDARFMLYFILIVSAIGIATILSVAVVDVMTSTS